MIDNLTVTNDNLIPNKGEGFAPPPPPSPSISSSSQKGSSSEAVTLEISQEMKGTSLSKTMANEVSKSSQKEKEGDSELEKKLSESVTALNEKLNSMDREIQFKLDKKINKNYISVIDKNSKEIIREFPPEEIRAFIARFDEINEKLSMSPDLKSMIINLEV